MNSCPCLYSLIRGSSEPIDKRFSKTFLLGVVFVLSISGSYEGHWSGMLFIVVWWCLPYAVTC